MKPTELENMITNIGATAEIVYLYYSASLKAGASIPEAMALSRIFVEILLENASKRKE